MYLGIWQTMKKTTWDEARGVISKGKILHEGYGNDREFFDVAGVKIQLMHTRSGKMFRCTCKHHSLHDNGSVCTYVAALISYLTLIKTKKEKKNE